MAVVRELVDVDEDGFEFRNKKLGSGDEIALGFDTSVSKDHGRPWVVSCITKDDEVHWHKQFATYEAALLEYENWN